jgi:outer membrane protein TolC
MRIVPISAPSSDARTFDGDAAVRAALVNRTDLQQSHKDLEATNINLRYFRNQTLPDVTASFDYGVTGLGGTQFVRGSGFPGPIVGQTQRGFGDVLRDLFVNDFPAWTASLTVSYPIGPTPEDASLARTQLEYTQLQVELRNQELLVATEVRNATRQAMTNQRRIEATRVSRQLMERRLEAEQRKFDAGTSTTFFVFQAQRDLAQARSDELRALLDYNRSIVDFETVQEAPLR